MNHRQRAMAILNYQDYDRLPVVHFGYWKETLLQWAEEGHITRDQAAGWDDGNAVDAAIGARLGFDLNWANTFSPITRLYPPIEPRVLATLADGSRHVLTRDGAVIVEKDGASGIPPELDHLLKSRKEWDELFRPRLHFCEERIAGVAVRTPAGDLPFLSGGLEYLRRGEWDLPLGLFCGSLYGIVRDWLGLTGTAYLRVDDPILFDEILDTVGELSYQLTAAVLATGARFDFAHFWEDICFKGGPLIHPRLFREKVGPHYRRITELLRGHGIDLVSLDCDGQIDRLLPIWLENGVNTMFPIEVGTWEASIAPWRAQYGRELRGVGGMDKRVFARDYAAVDAEIERLRPLVALGGYIPCPDHRLAPDAKWENVQYYCARMRQVFS